MSLGLSEGANAPNAEITPIKVEGAIAQIRAAIERSKTSKATLQNSSPSDSGTQDSNKYTPVIKTESDTFDDIEKVLRGLESTLLNLSDDDENTAIEVPEINAAEEARWQQRTPLPVSVRTHPTSFEPYDYHVDDLLTFKNDLINAKKCSDAPKSAYTKVEVLLLTWEECDDIRSDIDEEVEELTKLFGDLNYNLTEFAIPNIDCQNELQFKVLEFLRAHKKAPAGETLFIIYYTGHGSIRGNSSYWHPTGFAATPSNRRDLESPQNGPTLEWSKIQSNFDSVTDKDVLFIFDCCYAGAAVMHKGAGNTKEILAACSSEEQTPAGNDSFTHRLIRCIRNMIQTTPVFQVAWLYEAMVSVSQHPLCLHVNLNQSPSSICLRSLAIDEKTEQKTALPTTDDGHLAPPSPGRGRASSVGSTSDPLQSVFSGEDPSDLTTEVTTPEPVPVIPTNWHYKVLLSVKLKQNVLPKAGDWCLNFPPGQVEGLEDVTFQSLYPTKSTLLLLTMPVRQWILLKDNPAYTFIDFVQGENLMHSHLPEISAPAQSVSRTNSAETTSSNPISLGEEETEFLDLLATMRDFFNSTSPPPGTSKAPGKIARTCQHIAAKIGVPSRLESDPRYSLVRHIMQHLIESYDEEGKVNGYRYDMHLRMEVSKLFEKSFQSIKDTLKNAKVGTGNVKLENAIESEIENLEKEVVGLTRIDTGTVKRFVDEGTKGSSSRPKSRISSIPEEGVKEPRMERRHSTRPFSRANSSSFLPKTGAVRNSKEGSQPLTTFLKRKLSSLQGRTSLSADEKTKGGSAGHVPSPRTSVML